jgi:iron(III) transport system substrate-binding protein
MNRMIRPLTVLVAALIAFDARAEGVVNLYSARHYDTDDRLYEKFKEETGIEVKTIEGDSDALLERLGREGERSPADVFITVDAGRLDKAEGQGIFAPVESKVLSERVPAHLRHPENLWFGITQRVRVILVSKERVEPGAITRYEDLADPKWRKRVLIRSSSNVYNQSLVGSLIAQHGEDAALKWCEALVANMARPPQGGDRDQIRAVAAGEGDVAVSNHYYYARMLTSEDAADREAASAVRLVFPNQKDRGAHVNISGAGLVKTAPNKANAIRFLEFLVSEEAQKVFAAGNYEYPVVKGVEPPAALKQFGEFKADVVSAHEFGKHNQKAIRLMDRATWR